MPKKPKTHHGRTPEPRENANARGYNFRWQKASKAWLILHPLCAIHLAKGLKVLATCVDHIQPHRGDPELFWDQNNWQSACKSCHNAKTAAGG